MSSLERDRKDFLNLKFDEFLNIKLRHKRFQIVGVCKHCKSLLQGACQRWPLRQFIVNWKPLFQLAVTTLRYLGPDYSPKLLDHRLLKQKTTSLSHLAAGS